MNIKVSGVGSVANGEYEHVSLHGNVKLFGLVKCKSLTARGKARGEQIVCDKNIKAAGSGTFTGKVTAQEIKASGHYTFGSDVIAQNSLHCAGNVKCTGDMEAEKIKIRGCLQCEGLLNAEDFDVKFDSTTRLGSVGGKKISIRLKLMQKILQCIAIFPLFIRKWRARTHVKFAVEGDDIFMNHTVCPRVTGKNVCIGRGCNIDLVQYNETVKISKNSKVGKVEKI